MNRLVYIITLSLAFFLTSCTRDYIPAMPEEYWGYFPYEKGDGVVFSNGDEEMYFEITDKYINSQDRWVYGINRTERSEMWFCAKATSHRLNMKGTIAVNKNLSGAKFMIAIDDQRGSVEKSSCFEMRHNNTPSKMVFTLPYSVEEAENTVINFIVLENERGITSFYDAANDVEWTLKEIIH